MKKRLIPNRDDSAQNEENINQARVQYLKELREKDPIAFRREMERVKDDVHECLGRNDGHSEIDKAAILKKLKQFMNAKPASEKPASKTKDYVKAVDGELKVESKPVGQLSPKTKKALLEMQEKTEKLRDGYGDWWNKDASSISY